MVETTWLKETDPQAHSGLYVPLPQVWNQFIALDENKADLAHFLSAKLMQRAQDYPDEHKVVAGGLSPDNVKSRRHDLHNLAANNEEADIY